MMVNIMESICGALRVKYHPTSKKDFMMILEINVNLMYIQNLIIIYLKKFQFMVIYSLEILITMLVLLHIL